jgi:hypothetical protein
MSIKRDSADLLFFVWIERHNNRLGQTRMGSASGLGHPHRPSRDECDE